MNDNELKVFQDYVSQLEGGTITVAWAQRINDGMDVYPFLVVEKGDKIFQCLGLMDEEGNGPGFFEIGELPK